MMLIWHKILPVFFLPLGLGIALVMLGALLRKRSLLWSGILVLWGLSMPVTGDWLIRQVEGARVRKDIGVVEQADAVVVLGGMVSQVPGARYGEWRDAVDRFEGGVELFQAGKASLMILAGSWVPWVPNARPEGDILAERAEKLGVPPSVIQVTGKVGNTADEAEAVRVMLSGIERPKVILVTSAFHMSRAAMLFRRAGIEVETFPVDFRASPGKVLTLYDFLPGASGLNNSEIAFREVMGTLYYRLKR